MFGWFRAWRRRRQEAKIRAIFEFWDGSNFRKIDPWRAYREIQADAKFNLESHLDFVQLGQEPETGDCLACIMRVFGVSKFDGKTGRGLTDGEMLKLLFDLSEYLDALQKKTLIGPTSLPPTTDSIPAVSPDSQPSPTNSPSVSGSTSTAPNSAEVSPLPAESNTASLE